MQMTREQIDRALRSIKETYRRRPTEGLPADLAHLDSLKLSAATLPEDKRLSRDIVNLRSSVFGELEGRLRDETREMEQRHRNERAAMDAKVREAKKLR